MTQFLLMKSYLAPAIDLVKKVGQQILQAYEDYLNTSQILVQTKADASIVTAADLQANQMLLEGLQKLTPAIPILSEESNPIPFASRKGWPMHWLIDPLDGTRDFINCTGNFTINLALICNHQALLGIIYAPLTQTCYFAHLEEGVYKQVGDNNVVPICSKKHSDRLTVIASRYHNDPQELQQILAKIGHYELLQLGSALKFGLIAEGLADIYIRLGTTAEWDTAAGQCIVEQAGGKVVDITGKRLTYNCQEDLLNPFFIAVGDSEYEWLRYL